MTAIDDVEVDGDRLWREADPGGWLIERRGVLDRGEAAWLEVLARFDLAQGWKEDGHLSGVAWLMWKVGMSRGTAFEKLRVAHEMCRRPTLATALGSGEISYSAARAISRLDRPDTAVDEALIGVARVGTVLDVERAVRHYQLCAEQERPPGHRHELRGVWTRRSWDGLGTADIVLDAVELEELDAALTAFMAERPPDPGDESSRGDGAGPGGSAGGAPGGVDESSRGDGAGPGGSAGGPVASVDESSRGDGSPDLGSLPQRRADAFMDMIRTALAHVGEPQASGGERYQVHIVSDLTGEQGEHLDRTPLDPAVVARICCDASVVTHETGSDGELRLGRRTRVWNVNQRRAVAVRDGGTCRFPGCTRTICDIHHVQPWGQGGRTDMDNGILVCTRHHTLLHERFTATGNANDTITIHRHDGSILATSPPVRQPIPPS